MTPQIKRLREWCEFQKADLATHKWKDVFWEECMQRVSDVEFLCNQIEKAYFIIANIYGYRAINKEIVEEWLRQYGEVEDETKD